MERTSLEPKYYLGSETLASVCHAVSDPLRVNILRVLRFDSFGVLELCRIFDMPQPGMSHHLKVLLKARLVNTRREGNSIFYRREMILSNDCLSSFKMKLFGTIDSVRLDDPYQEIIRDIHKSRSESSRDFFERNALKFATKQALVADYLQYSKILQEILGNMRFSREDSAMEIGPGEGDLLCHLSSLFSRVYAFDNSKEMLERARSNVSGKGFFNIFFYEGDPKEATRYDIMVDLLVFNMVLHHLAYPAAFFHDAKRLLKSEGRLLLVELCSHDQTWVRDSCGDVWLGFRPTDLNEWAEDAGFFEIQSLYIGLKNGFQIQMRVFERS
ncbi:MAG: metalloregulator ArsR/SmtB family transcription factor [Oligoflexales bacterium]|nr:metalloregulator ArsR/SmtB family transcription factor [Oligoflexales bacterium]